MAPNNDDSNKKQGFVTKEEATRFTSYKSLSNSVLDLGIIGANVAVLRPAIQEWSLSHNDGLAMAKIVLSVLSIALCLAQAGILLAMIRVDPQVVDDGPRDGRCCCSSCSDAFPCCNRNPFRVWQELRLKGTRRTYFCMCCCKKELDHADDRIDAALFGIRWHVLSERWGGRFQHYPYMLRHVFIKYWPILETDEGRTKLFDHYDDPDYIPRTRLLMYKELKDEYNNTGHHQGFALDDQTVEEWALADYRLEAKQRRGKVLKLHKMAHKGERKMTHTDEQDGTGDTRDTESMYDASTYDAERGESDSDEAASDVPKNAIGKEMTLSPLPNWNVYYCGRLIGKEKMPHTNGFCGPTDGPQCPDCYQAMPMVPPDYYTVPGLAPKTNAEHTFRGFPQELQDAVMSIAFIIFVVNAALGYLSK